MDISVGEVWLIRVSGNLTATEKEEYDLVYVRDEIVFGANLALLDSTDGTMCRGMAYYCYDKFVEYGYVEFIERVEDAEI